MLLRQLIQPFTTHRYLLIQLTQREIKARYKQSFVGYSWVLLNPLAQLLVYSFVFSIVFRFPTNNVPYPIFLFSALLPWTLFQSSVLTATQSLVANSSLLRKVAFPREVIPYSIVLSKIVDFFFSSLVFVAFLIFYQIGLSASAFLFIPLFIIQILLSTSLSLLFSAANLFYRDVQYLVNLLVMLWMYVTPIIYSLEMVPKQYLWIYNLNPMVGIIEGYRAALFGTPIDYEIIGWSAFSSVVLFLLTYILFKRWEKVFADIA
jgi:lipopolysaccharide transport system permease protein